MRRPVDDTQIYRANRDLCERDFVSVAWWNRTVRGSGSSLCTGTTLEALVAPNVRGAASLRPRRHCSLGTSLSRIPRSHAKRFMPQRITRDRRVVVWQVAAVEIGDQLGSDGGGKKLSSTRCRKPVRPA
jgi:hypothetical protein